MKKNLQLVRLLALISQYKLVYKLESDIKGMNQIRITVMFDDFKLCYSNMNGCVILCMAQFDHDWEEVDEYAFFTTLEEELMDLG